MNDTLDLISHTALRELRSFTRRTGQPAKLDGLDLVPMENVQEIEIDEEHITIVYNQKTTHRYNANEITQKEWTYKYNDDPEFVKAIAAVIDLAREHQRDMPDNVACPPGCAECCSGYEPFVNRADVQRIADYFEMSYDQAFADYVVPRISADGFVVGYLKKVGNDISDQCIFLKGSGSGKFYCGIYEGRPADCRAFTPIGCDDVDTDIKRDRKFAPGSPFGPKNRPKTAVKRMR
jgi:Fe-S-cluster containining protein